MLDTLDNNQLKLKQGYVMNDFNQCHFPDARALNWFYFAFQEWFTFIEYSKVQCR
jgi:hypothetical protein